MKMHTDNGFTFDIKEDHATVMEIDGDPQIVEIPEQIDGVPVTELAEYLFSGKSCQVIRIPLGVRKIGRYGFYNCRNLKKLSFGGALRDLGAGALTGCHQVSELNVRLGENDRSCLREILTELPETLCVKIKKRIRRAASGFRNFLRRG